MNKVTKAKAIEMLKQKTFAYIGNITFKNVEDAHNFLSRFKERIDRGYKTSTKNRTFLSSNTKSIAFATDENEVTYLYFASFNKAWKYKNFLILYHIGTYMKFIIYQLEEEQYA